MTIQRRQRFLVDRDAQRRSLRVSIRLDGRRRFRIDERGFDFLGIDLVVSRDFDVANSLNTLSFISNFAGRSPA